MASSQRAWKLGCSFGKGLQNVQLRLFGRQNGPIQRLWCFPAVPQTVEEMRIDLAEKGASTSLLCR